MATYLGVFHSPAETLATVGGAVWNLMSLVILIESAVPTAQNVIMLLLVQGDPAQGQAMALIILYQMLVAVPVFTAWTALFMTLSI